MSNFNQTDLTTGVVRHLNGKIVAIDGNDYRELSTQGSTDSYQVVAATTSNVAVLTGSGNDSIDLSGATGMSFINAGAGTNTIAAGPGQADFVVNETATQAFSQPYTLDMISNFHAGDNLTFTGVTSLNETIRGGMTNYTAWNGAVPGSAVYASFSNLAAPLTVTQSGDQITLRA